MISELEAILDGVDQSTIIKLIKKLFKNTKFTTITRETVTDGVKLHFKFIDDTEIVSPIIYEITDADVQILKRKVEELERRIEALETKVNEHDNKISALEIKTDDLQHDIDAIREVVNDLSGKLTDLTARVTNTENRLTSAEQDIGVLKTDKADRTELPEANNGEATTGTLDTLKVGGVNYKVEGGGGGTSDYNDLNNKPTIDGVELRKGTTHSDLGLLSTEYKTITDNHLDQHDQAISEAQVNIANLQNGKADRTELPVANNGEATTADLTSLKVGGVNYNIPSGSGGNLYVHNIHLKGRYSGAPGTHSTIFLSFTVLCKSSTRFNSVSDIYPYIDDNATIMASGLLIDTDNTNCSIAYVTISKVLSLYNLTVYYNVQGGSPSYDLKSYLFNDITYFNDSSTLVH